MSKLIEKTGNLFDSDAPAIGHGVNTYGLMGAGIAKQFKEKFPQMYSVYKHSCIVGNLKPGQVLIWDKTKPIVYNIASQDVPGASAKIGWLVQGVMEACKDADRRGLARIALPYIGAGIGGLYTADVKSTLAEIAESWTVDIELWKYVGTSN